MDTHLASLVRSEESLERRQEILDAQRRIAAGERPWEQVQGEASVLEAVRDFRFPTTADELAAVIGWRHVTLGGHARVGMREVLAAMAPDQAFLSLADFQAALERRWPEVRRLGWG